MHFTAKHSGYKVWFKVMAAPIKFSEHLKTISNCLNTLFVFSKQITSRSLVSRDILVHNVHKTKIKATFTFFSKLPIIHMFHSSTWLRLCYCHLFASMKSNKTPNFSSLLPSSNNCICRYGSQQKHFISFPVTVHELTKLQFVEY